MDRGKLYSELYELWIKAYPQFKKQKIQSDCNCFWNNIKNNDNFMDLYTSKISDLKRNIRSQKSIISFFDQPSTSATHRQPIASVTLSKTQSPSSNNENEVLENLTSNPESANKDNQLQPVALVASSVTTNKAPKQEELRKELSILNAELASYSVREAADLMSDEQRRELKTKKKRKIEVENEIEKLKAGQQRSKKFREEKKATLQQIVSENPDLESKIKLKSRPGRPAITDEQPNILDAIINIAMHGSAAHERRRMEILRSVRTLDELHRELENMGYKLSRSAVYYHLQPANIRTLDGKRHINTAPVKLIRAQNTLHKDHKDAKFAAATISNLNELASLLGHDDVAMISQDDKCRVPIGITAAKAQAPILMHMQYRVALPDHDWIVGEKHKLIPSVYAGLAIKDNGYGSKDAVSYSGPTYISIRSGKHSSSTAKTHARDFSKLMEIDEFDTITKTESGEIKPIFIILVDGGPDENPRYPKTIKSAIHHFKQYNLDALFIATNAPGRSAFNPVERRMAPLSRQLSGVILPHENFGTHLDGNGKTVDLELEKQNFEYAGETLAKIFSDVVIDNYPVITEYVKPEKDESFQDYHEVDETWKMNHIRSSQYFLQIVKCSNESCCSSPRSSFSDFFPNQFLPAPVSMKYEPKLKFADPKDTNSRFATLFQSLSFPGSTNTPYDKYCPSVADIIKERVCIDCGYYCASIDMLKNHRKDIHKRIVNTKKKPRKVISRREKEVLVQLQDDLDWMEAENLEIEEEPISVYQAVDSNVEFRNIFTVEEHLQQIWGNE
jgi:hypothetical protein